MSTKYLHSNMGRILFGFGTLANRVPPEIEPYWADRPMKTQVHHNHIVVVHEPRGQYGEADGIVTSVPGVLASVVTADCVPVLLARRDESRVAALHIGWRGAKSGIINSLDSLLKEDGDSLNDWVAIIGPAIGPCCFEVSPVLAQEFRTITELPVEVLEPKREFYLDLPKIVEYQLHSSGIAHVSSITRCTSCTTDGNKEYTYLSHRRDGTQLYQWSGILICDP